MPIYIAPIIFFSAVATVGALAWMITATTRKSGFPELRTAGLAVIVALLVWISLAVALSILRAYEANPRGMPTIQFGIVIPVILGVLAYVVWPKVRQLVRGIPQQWLIGIQVYRAGGALFLVLWMVGLIPGLFAAPAGIGDLLVGCAAPTIAWLFAKGSAGRGKLALVWNLLGLLDLATALALGFVTTPSRFQLLATDHSSTIITQFPLVLIPTFIVPLSILLHLASLAKLRSVQL